MVSVVIPTYKNKAKLLSNLKHNLRYLKDCQVIVVNDDPKESIRYDVKQLDIMLLENKQNLGFAGAVNRGVAKAKNDLILLLNDDVVLHDNSYTKILSRFRQNDKLFAVTFAQKDTGGKMVGKNVVFWSLGFIRHKRAGDLTLGFNAWAEGGASLVDRKKYLSLSGFDQLYSPFYWEDIDLSYRAWKSGYQILFDPHVKVTHPHESTIGTQFKKSFVKKIAYRNQFIFIWKNITDPGLVLNHLVFLIPNFIFFLLRGEFTFFLGFISALYKLPRIMKGRASQKRNFVMTDWALLHLFV
ncbi:glycosyltransferase family 2 protein [Candidatus Roizmanbacteria bacterium]|nr:glycosyltransferase family 2 protein [Candidatus Roizmanbacteria bacterium]